MEQQTGISSAPTAGLNGLLTKKETKMPATSEKQKKFMGAVMGCKKKPSTCSPATKKAAKSMTKKQVKDFLKKPKK